jgi:membrane protein required for colicin V production
MRWGASVKADGSKPLFDLIVILMIALSALVGFIRGAVREVVTVVAFVLAALLAIFTLSLTAPLGRQAINPDWLGSVLALMIVFIVAYVGFRLLGGLLTRRIHQVKAIGTFDRIVGVGFGLIRALVVLGVFYLAFNIATPPERAPAWVVDAKLYPLTEVAGRALQQVAKQGSTVFGDVTPSLEKAVVEGVKAPQSADDKPEDKKPQQGYDARARSKMDDLVEKSR